MKRSFLLFTAVAGVSYLTLTSYSGGPATGGAGNRTGSPGSAGTCADAANGCHGASSSNTVMTLFVADPSAPTTPVTNYIPGKTYMVAVGGTNASQNAFGFQVIALKQSNNTETGTVAITDAKTQIVSGHTALVEHNQPIGKTGSIYATSFNWTAPAAGTGSVALYGMLNAINGDTFPTGDEPSNPVSVTLTEATNSVASLSSGIKISAFPNPATSNVNIKFEDAERGNYFLKVMDVNGKTIQTESVRINGSGSIILQTSNWASGLHFVEIMKDGAQRMIPIVKN